MNLDETIDTKRTNGDLDNVLWHRIIQGNWILLLCHRRGHPHGAVLLGSVRGSDGTVEVGLEGQRILESAQDSVRAERVRVGHQLVGDVRLGHVGLLHAPDLQSIDKIP